MTNYFDKYTKYKKKYMKLKQLAGNSDIFKISEDFVNEYIKLRPLIATFWGINTYDNEWGDISTQSYDDEYKLLTKYQNMINKPRTMDKWTELAYYYLEDQIQLNLQIIKDLYYDLSSTLSTFQQLVEAFDVMPKETSKDWDNIVSRLKSYDTAMDQYTQRLREGIAKNQVVAQRQVKAVIHIAEDLAKTFGTGLIEDNEEHKFIDPKQLKKLCNKKKMFMKFIKFLQDEYLPHAPLEDAVGEERYSNYVRQHIGNKIDLHDTYAWGFKEVNYLIAEMDKLCGGHNCYLDLIEKAKVDPKFIINTPEEFMEYIQSIQQDAITKLDKYFEIPDDLKTIEVKKSPLNVVLAQYLPPSPDFKRPGCITYGFEKDVPIPLYDQLSTAYHEGFPGHHLQLGLQTYFRDNLTLLGRLVGYAGFAEGWALYTEKFMLEINMYPHKYYVLGMYANSLFRACRVVIDIGLHLKLQIPKDFFFHGGEVWTYDIAKEMLMKVVGLSDAYSTDEVNRYCGWAGQAISYKVGERKIFELRNKMQKKQGSKFDIKEFHKKVLEFGSVGLDYLEEHFDKN
jgi:uncharacterized protein (DUF885 family)